MKWIPVSERMPEVGKFVVVYSTCLPYYFIARRFEWEDGDSYWRNEINDLLDSSIEQSIVEWIPLPEHHTETEKN